MSTMTVPTTESTPHAPARRPVWVLVLVAAVALAVGVAGGVWVASALDDGPDAVAASGELSGQQEQVVDAVRRYQEAWLASDAAAVTAAYAPGGVMVWQGEEFRADDGSVASFVGRIDWSVSMVVSDVVLVDKTTAVYTHTVMGWQYVDVVELTSTGDPLVRRHVQISEIDHPVNILAPEQ